MRDLPVAERSAPTTGCLSARENSADLRADPEEGSAPSKKRIGAGVLPLHRRFDGRRAPRPTWARAFVLRPLRVKLPNAFTLPYIPPHGAARRAIDDEVCFALFAMFFSLFGSAYTIRPQGCARHEQMLASSIFWCARQVRASPASAVRDGQRLPFDHRVGFRERRAKPHGHF